MAFISIDRLGTDVRSVAVELFRLEAVVPATRGHAWPCLTWPRVLTLPRVRRGEEYSVVRIGFESSVDSLEEVMAVMPRLLRDPVALKLEA